MTAIRGSAAALTGGASGIGRALALRFVIPAAAAVAISTNGISIVASAVISKAIAAVSAAAAAGFTMPFAPASPPASIARMGLAESCPLKL